MNSDSAASYYNCNTTVPSLPSLLPALNMKMERKTFTLYLSKRGYSMSENKLLGGLVEAMNALSSTAEDGYLLQAA